MEFFERSAIERVVVSFPPERPLNDQQRPSARIRSSRDVKSTLALLLTASIVFWLLLVYWWFAIIN